MVSVLVLSWNHEKYIHQCLYSIINQTYKDIEIIYLDNNSSDKTFVTGKNVLENAGVKYEAYQTQENFGIAHNMNTLFSKLHGEYICLVSADDWLHKKNIEEKIKVFSSNAFTGMVYSTGYKFYNDAGVYELMGSSFIKKEDIFQELLKRNFVTGLGSLIKREVIETVGGWDETLLLEDGDMWLRIAQKYQIYFLDKPLFVYRIHGCGISSDPEFMYKGKVQLYEKYKHLNNNKLSTLSNITENYLANKVMISAPFSTTGKVLKNFKFNKLFAKILIKSMLPVALKKWYFNTSLKRRNTHIDASAFKDM